MPTTTRFPIAVLKRAAEALLPGPDVTRQEQRHGRKAKLTVLRELIKADPAFRKKVRAFCIQDQTAKSKAYAQEMGWLGQGEAQAPDDGRLAYWTASYKADEAKEIAEKGSSNLTRCFADECGSFLADCLHGRKPFRYRDHVELLAALKDRMDTKPSL